MDFPTHKFGKQLEVAARLIAAERPAVLVVVGIRLKDLEDLVAFRVVMVPSITVRQVKRLIQKSCLRHSLVEVLDVEIVVHEKDQIFKCMSV